MVDYKIKKGRLEGKYFLVYICDNKDIVDRIAFGIGGFMDTYEDKLKQIKDYYNNLKATQEINKKPTEENNENV